MLQSITLRLWSAALLSSMAFSMAATCSLQSDCSNTGRTETSKAGTIAGPSVPCASITITITIMGQEITLTSPSECPDSKVVRDADCFDCGGTSTGTNCNAQGFAIRVKTYDHGDESPCPTGPTGVPDTIAEFVRSMSCLPPPLVNDEKTWCAGIVACIQSPEPATLDTVHASTEPSEWPGTQVAIRRNWLGDLAGTLPQAQPGPLDVFRSALPRDAASDLPELLRLAYTGHAPLFGVADLHATTTVEYLAGSGHDGLVNVWEPSGVIMADGTLSVSSPRRSSTQGEANSYSEVLAFDGSNLFTGRIGADAFQVYACTHPGFDWIVDRELFPLQSLRRWVVNPFLIQRLRDAEYEVLEVDAAGLFDVVETYPEPAFPQWAGSMIYTIQAGSESARPTQVEVLDGLGRRLVLRQFGDYRPVGETSRPFAFDEWRYRDGAAEPYLHLSHRIRFAATPLNAGSAESAWTQPEPASGWWIVHE